MKTFKQKCESEEWEAWSFISEMLDAPNPINGIYKTSKCYEQVHDFVVEQKIKEIKMFMEEIQKRANKIPPNLLLNEVVNYSHDRMKSLLN